jgi:hypothetical protein
MAAPGVRGAPANDANFADVAEHPGESARQPRRSKKSIANLAPRNARTVEGGQKAAVVEKYDATAKG